MVQKSSIREDLSLKSTIKQTKTTISHSENKSEQESRHVLEVKHTDLRCTVIGLTNQALENMTIDKESDNPVWPTRWEGLIATLSFITCSRWFPVQFAICYIIISVPLLYMEIALGQYSSASPLSVFSRMVPAMAGISAGMCFILVFRSVSLSVWTTYDLVLFEKTSEAIYSTADWETCANDDSVCLDPKLTSCTWMDPYVDRKCHQFLQATIENRAHQYRKSPFISYIQRLLFKKSMSSEWEIPSIACCVSALLIWLIVGFISIKGSLILGKTGIVSLVFLIISTVSLVITGFTLEDSYEATKLFFWKKSVHDTLLMWLWSWADAASLAVRALCIGCGGIQKMASLNKFHHPFQKDVLIFSIIPFLLYISVGWYSYMFMAQISKFYYPDLATEDRLSLFTAPILIEAAITQILSYQSVGKVIIFIFWLTLVICGIQGLASYIWIISSMLIERINGSRRKYGQPLTTPTRRAFIVTLLCVFSYISSFPFLGNGGINLMATVESCASYGILFLAFAETVTISHLYGFRRFCVNIRSMIGGHGAVNIYWWLNWLILCPILLITMFGCVVATFRTRREFLATTDFTVEVMGWCLLLISIVFALLYFLKEEVDRRMNKEPFDTLFRATGDWGPASSENRKEAQWKERQLRVRF